jgi:hypothetical protein
MSDTETKTNFRGPGEWRSQAARLEAERDQEPEEDDES